MQSQGGSECLLPEHEDILMKKILQTHAPEEHQVDSASLLDLTERIFLNFAVSSVRKDCRSKEDAKIVNAVKELGITVHHMSCEMLQHISTDRPPKATTCVLLESLERHRWSTKLTIVLAALASSYGNYWLIARFCLTNPLALSLAAMKGQLRNSLKTTTILNYRLKALRYLLEKMVSVAKCVMAFEILPTNYVSQDYEALAMMKNQVHIASYWVIRSSVECASQITSTIASGVESNLQAKVTPQVWELWSLAKKISYIYEVLRNNFDAFSQQIEKKVHLRLVNLFAGVHDNNQDVLYTLFAQKDDFPLRDSCSQEKVGVNVLSNKVVMLFISSLNIYPEKLLLVVQQSEKKIHNRPEEEYEIVWIPAMFSAQEVERRVYDQVVDILPWYSITEPSNLSSSVMKFIKEVWHFQGDSMMVALDHGGNVSSLDAFDMVAIWGSKAYPFTTSKERELWEEQRWTMELLLDSIDPLFSYWMEERRIICLYGTNDLGWARELSKKMKALSEAGVPVELIYVGSNMQEQTSSTLTRIMEEKLSRYLSHVNIRIFWLRLQSMRSSRQRLGYASESDDSITQEIDSLLSSDTRSSGWLLVGEGASGEVLKLWGNQVLESLSNLHAWGQKIRRLGFLGALLKSLGTSATEPCDYSVVTPFSESSINGESSVCKKCKSIMEKHIMYQCGTC
ncbi:protein SIEVE ELEMENT OCCLUSION C-like [Zingiber officinale]|uniref:Protein SIEVE ELEMENT OCCLUSION C n=1 Tax=Zingiber officinale TaxID=94328 RepID=A0A8J5LEX9_ZINOF|nr:protein SIEVE ELEMENT OCCLUSION C-like [Zingiber officinale]KAG6516196.1 hypothetical protein ZIOFF_026645 [Zingiber officinale]